MTDKYHPTKSMTDWELFLAGAGGGLKTNAGDFLNVVNLRRPTLEEETERASLVRPLTATPWGNTGYEIGRLFPFPPVRDFLPPFFRDGADAERIARRKQYQAKMRAKFLHPYDTNQMGAPNVDGLRGLLDASPPQMPGGYLGLLEP